MGFGVGGEVLNDRVFGIIEQVEGGMPVRQDKMPAIQFVALLVGIDAVKVSIRGRKQQILGA